MPSWSQKIEARNFPADFCTRIFWGRVSLYAATQIFVVLSPCHSDITRFRQSSTIATGKHLDRAEKIPKFAQTTGTADFFIRVQAFRDHFAKSFRMSKSSWVMDPTRSREMRSSSTIDLAEIRRSSKSSSWIWSIISGVVTILGPPGRGATQVGKLPRLNWATQFLTVA